MSVFTLSLKRFLCGHKEEIFTFSKENEKRRCTACEEYHLNFNEYPPLDLPLREVIDAVIKIEEDGLSYYSQCDNFT